MATTAHRRLAPTKIRRFGSGREAEVFPDLTRIQTQSYAAFLQQGVTSDKRKDHGLESVLREIFPIESYDKTINLEYVKYELGKPRYTPDECRQLRLTFGRPFRVWLRFFPNVDLRTNSFGNNFICRIPCTPMLYIMIHVYEFI